MTFILNGVDYSDALWVKGYKLKTRKVTGPAAGYLLSGDHIADLRSIKKDVIFSFSAMEQSELSTLLQSCISEYVEMSFNDPILNLDISGTFEPEISELEQAIDNGPNKKYWYEFTITFKEK